MTRAPDWNIEGRDWPNRAASRFLSVNGLRWHVQMMGDGPPLVLLHGTGAATHSWRDLAPILSRTHTVVALDLPGHGFTAIPARSADFALPRVASSISQVLRDLGISPLALIGHSAGAAIAVRMVLDGAASPAGIIGINAALLPFPGPLGPLAPILARTLFYNPVSVGFFSYRAAMPGAIARLMRSTGSTLDQRGLELYERLFRASSHLEATVALMAHWDLNALQHDLPKLRVPLTLIVGGKDRAVPPDAAETVRGMVSQARIKTLNGLGHLAHEEDPAAVADIILAALRSEP